MPEQSESTFQDLERLVIGTNKISTGGKSPSAHPVCAASACPTGRYCEKNDEWTSSCRRWRAHSNAKKKDSIICTENATVGSVSCQRHMAYVINNDRRSAEQDPVTGEQGIKQPPITSNPIAAPDRSTDHECPQRFDISPTLCR